MNPETPAFLSPAPETLWREPIAVLGYGAEGKSTLAHLRRWGYKDIVVLDKAAPAEPLPQGVRGVFGAAYLEALAGIKTAFRSPGVRPFVPEIEAFRDRGGALTSQVEAAFALLGRHRIIGVTGTAGKGTCCSLLSAMLQEAALPYRLAGNIGVPPLDALYGEGGLEARAWLLLELSSFQLSTLAESPRLAVALRTTSEHLDWHASRDEYWDHKANLTRFQEPGDACVYFADAEGSREIGLRGRGRKIAVGAGASADVRLTEDAVDWPAGGVRISLDETRMTGAFNLENVGAAAAAARELGASPAAVRAGARAFSPLEHRIEFVREIEQGGRRVRYYNDSYATRPEATLAAVRALNRGDVGLILGGSEKFADFSEMAAALAGAPHLRAVALIGQTAPRLEEELRRAGALAGRAWRRCESLEEALEFLRGEIAAGAILLSPACASFGLFANYKERGYAFKKLVNALPG
ncbi:MAG: UDP-N-acetylmuramoylalanine/D-glutamate ligase [Fibrobacteria bacterium]|nr:UDP-N-acetylmuramoylalanine/D-glutamate ligase [Fibrobacteria bacterium]